MQRLTHVLALMPLALVLAPRQGEAGGCAVPISVFNSRIGTADAGGFDLTATSFAGKGAPGPEIRFWAHGNFAKANSGAQDQFTDGMLWLFNSAVDAKLKEAGPNVFSLYQTNWMGPKIDGCGFDLPERRTVVELSFADANLEGKPEHRGFYAVASVPYSSTMSSYDFDDVRGATGKSGNVVPVAPIPAPIVKSAAKPSGGYVVLNLELPAAVSYSEKGKDLPVKLIAGYRILYAEGAAPTSSDPAKYLRARDAQNPAKEAGTLKPGMNAVAVPAGKDAWLVAQIVYDDPAPLLSRATSAHVPASAPAAAEADSPAGVRLRSTGKQR